MTTTTKKKRNFSKIHPIHKKRLRDLAEKHGQQWIAERLGVTASAVSRILQPGETGVRAKTIEAIIELVGKNGVEEPAASKVLHPKEVRSSLARRPAGDAFEIMSEVIAVLARVSPEERVRIVNMIKYFAQGTFA